MAYCGSESLGAAQHAGKLGAYHLQSTVDERLRSVVRLVSSPSPAAVPNLPLRCELTTERVDPPNLIPVVYMPGQRIDHRLPCCRGGKPLD